MALSEEILEKRKKYVTSTEVAAVFGVSKYRTPFSLWHLKKGELEESFESNERAEMGLAFERVIAELACQKLELPAPTSMDEFLTDDILKMAASFDFKTKKDGKRKIIECKAVDGIIFKNEWTVEGDEIIDEPLWIALQNQMQLMVSGDESLILAVLVGGNRLLVKIVEKNEKVQAAIREKVAEFWASKEPPPLTGPHWNCCLPELSKGRR